MLPFFARTISPSNSPSDRLSRSTSSFHCRRLTTTMTAVLFSCLTLVANAQVSLPKSFGDRLHWHHEIVADFRAVADASPCVVVEPYVEGAESVEGRELFHAVVASARNIRRLGEIRAMNARMRRTGRVPEDMPVIVWLGYGIHGNETSSPEAAIGVLHDLANRAEYVNGMLEDVVVIIDPLMNPDGRHRFMSHFGTFANAGGTPDRNAMEHHESWPNGRTNHFLFDLNRDWFLLSQQESRYRADALVRWRPHIVVDHHEMGTDSSYFFPPPPEPIAPTLPKFARQWLDHMGDAIAPAFDARGWSYWTKEVFDLFYPGYGGSWASYTGAVAATFEQATPGGARRRRSDGSVLTLRDAIEHHFVAGMETVRMASTQRKAFLTDLAAYHRDVRRRAAESEVRAYLLRPDPRPDALARLRDALIRQGIELLRTKKAVTVDGYRDLRGGAPRRETVPAGTLAVPVDQDSHDLVTVLLAPDIPFTDEFLKQDRQRVAEGKRSAIYDVTAWNVALTFGLEGAELTTELPEAFDTFTPAEVEFESSKTGATSRRSGLPMRPYAWMASSHDGSAARTLARLAGEDVNLRITTFDFRQGDVRMPRGSVLMLRGRNETDGSTLEDLAPDLVPVDGARNEIGLDLGSNQARVFVAPKIAIVGGQPANPYSFGGVRYALQEIVGIAATPIHAHRLRSVDLSAYNVIVVPDGGDYGRWFGDDGVTALKGWVDAGGTLVLLKNARKFLGGGKTPWLRAHAAKAKVETVRGALVRLDVDRTHWLASGLPKELVGQIRSNAPIAVYGEDEGRTAVRFAAAGKLRIAGLMDATQAGGFAGHSFVGVEEHGRGQVVLFAEDILARANMVGLMPLFMNAVVLGPTFR